MTALSLRTTQVRSLGGAMLRAIEILDEMERAVTDLGGDPESVEPIKSAYDRFAANTDKLLAGGR